MVVSTVCVPYTDVVTVCTIVAVFSENTSDVDVIVVAGRVTVTVTGLSVTYCVLTTVDG